MNDETLLAEYSPDNPAELDTLERELSRGALDRHRDRMMEFLDRHREEIVELAGDCRCPEAFLRASKILIIDAGGAHPYADLQDQLRAIHDEIWIRGERGEYDREFIVHDWTSRHARNWRRWRLKEYLFLVDKFAPEVIRHITTRLAAISRLAVI